ncbi:hypothetical protein PG995_011487 [Apiospora arundinis]
MQLALHTAGYIVTSIDRGPLESVRPVVARVVLREPDGLRIDLLPHVIQVLKFVRVVVRYHLQEALGIPRPYVAKAGAAALDGVPVLSNTDAGRVVNHQNQALQCRGLTDPGEFKPVRATTPLCVRYRDGLARGEKSHVPVRFEATHAEFVYWIHVQNILWRGPESDVGAAEPAASFAMHNVPCFTAGVGCARHVSPSVEVEEHGVVVVLPVDELGRHPGGHLPDLEPQLRWQLPEPVERGAPAGAFWFR